MTDLSDFGGGVDKSNLSDRDRKIEDLADWLRGDDTEVYSHSALPFANGTFDTSTRSQPDLLVLSQTNNYVLKYAQADEDSQSVHDTALRVYNYWKDLVRGDEEYSVNKQTIDIDAVLIATSYSRRGHLFTDKNNKDPLRSGRSKGAQEAASNNYLPDTECVSSETLLRIIWRFASESTEDADTGIGGLLSSNLDKDPDDADISNFEDSIPAALYYIPGRDPAQRWDYIPFYHQDD